MQRLGHCVLHPLTGRYANETCNIHMRFAMEFTNETCIKLTDLTSENFYDVMPDEFFGHNGGIYTSIF